MRTCYGEAKRNCRAHRYSAQDGLVKCSGFNEIGDIVSERRNGKIADRPGIGAPVTAAFQVQTPPAYIVGENLNRLGGITAKSMLENHRFAGATPADRKVDAGSELGCLS